MIRRRLDYNSMMTTNKARPKYSICICTKDMGDSIKLCIESIMMQINNEYEVIVVNDGSRDNTDFVLQQMKAQYSNITYVYLKRSRIRKLGFTRNYSFQIARGDWCIFHIDADDLIGHYLPQFVLLVESLDSSFPNGSLYAGKQIHMAKKEFLISKGPFRNIYRGEDRDFHERLIQAGSWILIDHKPFISRIPRSNIINAKKTVRDVIDQTINDMRKSKSIIQFLVYTWKIRKNFGTKIFLFKFIIAPYAIFRTKTLGYLSPNLVSNSDFTLYRDNNTKTYSNWCKDLGISRNKSVSHEIFY